MRKNKILSVGLFCLLLGAVCVAAIACRSSEQSKQLSVGLVQESDFGGDWEWLDASYSVARPSYIENDSTPPAETTYQALDAYYQSKEHRVKVFHDLQRYNETAPRLDKFEIWETSVNPGGDKFVPQLTDYGRGTLSECLVISKYDSSPATACSIAISYQHIVSTLDFKFYGNPSRKELEAILDGVLAQIDKRLMEIDLHLSENSY
jgi:hypothetical protein